MVVANEDSPVFLGGAFEAIASCYADHDVFVDAFRTGAGVGSQDHDDRLFSGVVRFFRPGYAAHLVGEWLPALDGGWSRSCRRGERGRRGVRTRCVHGHHGAGVRALDVRGLRHPRAVDRGCPHGRGAGRSQRARFSVARRRRTSRAGAMTWCACSTPCTTWATRSGGSPHPAGAGAGRHATAGRAERRRRPRAQPEPGRAGLLRPAPRSSARQVSWHRKSGWDSVGRPVNASSAIRAPRGRVHPRAPGNRDPIQHHSGGQTIGVAPIVASTDSPRARCSPPMRTSVRAHW